LIYLENNIKTSCYLDEIPDDFISYACHFSVILFRVPHISHLLPIQLLTPPTLKRHAFLPLSFVLVLFTYLI